MKDFIIIGNMNAVTFKDIFPLLKENKMFAGYHFNKSMYFEMPDDYEKYHHIENGKKIGLGPAICWYTSFQIDKRKEKLPLSRKYEGNEKHYPKYDNYDAIECSKTKNIPFDYDGVMGVPISFLEKYCPDQFEILGMSQRGCHDDVPDIKKYDDFAEMRQDGTETGCSGNKTNENPNLVGMPNKGNYFINSNGYVIHSCYQRIFICRKK